MTSANQTPDGSVGQVESAGTPDGRRAANQASEFAEPPLQILYSETGAEESPFADVPATRATGRAVSVDYQGGFSLEKFASAGSLRYTHEDASGWLSYLQKFNPSNFWYKDSGVRVWAYYEQYDNWQDTYGLDAVKAVYHSGHGGMTGDGRFWVPLGADWGGQGTNAWSDKMRLGNEQVRYVFWSTCVSCRVTGGHSPIRTWSKANLGFRMLFGYETVSYDNPNYGKYFWEEWNKGKNKSLSTAFLDASWRISHRQAPAVVACGATKDEAKNRVFNERYLNWDKVSSNWWWWRWYSAKSSATAARAPHQRVPDALLIAELRPASVNGRFVRRILEQHDVDVPLPTEVRATPNGVFSVANGTQSISLAPDGSYELQLAQPNTENTNELPLRQAVNAAEEYVARTGLNNEALVFDRVMDSLDAGGSDDGSGHVEPPTVSTTTIEFAQTINGIPVLSPGAGTVAVTVDNDGTVTGVKNSVRDIVNLTDRLKNSPAAPDEEKPAGDPSDPERLLAGAWQTQLTDLMARGQGPVQYNIVPGTYEIGYVVDGNVASLVARRDIEVDCGGGLRKRYSIQAPIAE